LSAPHGPRAPRSTARRVWLIDLDDTLHDASRAAFGPLAEAMTGYIADHLGVDAHTAAALRRHYWRRYGATLLGLVRHHGVDAAHFLEHTHRLPGLEQRLHTSAHDRIALARLRGTKVVLTNAPRAYALRVLGALRLLRHVDAVIAVEDMVMFGELRPKPDARMLRRLLARLRVPATRCVLVEDTLAHQKAAHALGMRTAWMQRYIGGRGGGHAGASSAMGSTAPKEGDERVAASVRRCPRPAYVCARIPSLLALTRLA